MHYLARNLIQDFLTAPWTTGNASHKRPVCDRKKIYFCKFRPKRVWNYTLFELTKYKIFFSPLDPRPVNTSHKRPLWDHQQIYISVNLDQKGPEIMQYLVRKMQKFSYASGRCKAPPTLATRLVTNPLDPREHFAQALGLRPPKIYIFLYLDQLRAWNICVIFSSQNEFIGKGELPPPGALNFFFWWVCATRVSKSRV